jgi:1-acyl-sn-glycerol-3-phosphate acyltransferase
VPNPQRDRFSLFQSFLWSVAYLLCRLLWRTRWHNAPELVAGRGAVIVCNHRSSVDPFFVQMSTGRKVHWMVAREYCENPALKGFLGSCEVIPVSRGGIDTAATKAAIRLAANGQVVGMLPEGRINMGEELLMAARPGAALVALKAGVPIIPCYIKGAPYRRYPWSPFVMPARVEVWFAPPIDVQPWLESGDDAAAKQLTVHALKAIAALAGQPDFEPQLAGRSWKPTAAELQAAYAAQEEREQRGTRTE